MRRQIYNLALAFQMLMKFAEQAGTMQSLIILFILPSLTLLVHCTDNSDLYNPVVKTSHGLLRGTIIERRNITINAFLGIPYAAPPVGDLRFKRPQPLQPWTEIYNAKTKPFSCPQSSITIHDELFVTGTRNSEDCLYLNIWSPYCPYAYYCEPKDVIVYIHGGAFSLGGTDLLIFDMSYLAAVGDVVAVSLNYRLGAFGYLYSGTEDAPGNMGIEDQRVAIEWVHQNIMQFGGDPNKITLMGVSAGSMSIGFHLESPDMRRLIHRVIMQSGSPNVHLPGSDVKSSMQQADKVSKLVGCNGHGSIVTHPTEVVECLRSVSDSEIVQASETLGTNGFLTFTPRRRETNLTESNECQPLDVLYSITQNEGGILAYFFLEKILEIDTKEMKSTRTLKNLIPLLMYAFLGRRIPAIESYYLAGVRDEDVRKMIQQISYSTGDIILTCPGLEYLKQLARCRHNVYFMEYAFRPKNSPWPEWVGATHGDDVLTTLGSGFFLKSHIDEKEEEFIEEMVKLVSTFAKTGHVPDFDGQIWPRYSLENPVHMTVTGTNFTLGTNLRKEPCDNLRRVLESSQ